MRLCLALLIFSHVIPVGGLIIIAAFKALNTAQNLHKPVCAFCICDHSINYAII